MNIRRRARTADRHRDHVAIEIEAMLAKAQPLFTRECCIYRVPHEIRKFKPDEYSPKVVSIGPFHHGDPKLLPMEDEKHIYCLKFIERSRPEVSLDDLVNLVQKSEPKVRGCYADNIKLSMEELVKVILVDCGFIIEIFSRHKFHDDVFLAPWLEFNVALDLLLLENQLPFFILKELYDLAFGEEPRYSFRDLTFHYFKGYAGKNLLLTGDDIEHFIDLLRTSHLQPNNAPPRMGKMLEHLYSATKLNEAGVKFKVKDESETKSILDLQFSGSYFEIPKIEVMDSTEMRLRNLLALEQCHYPRECFITSYVLFLDFLINTDKDVDVLVKNGIITNWLSDSNAVAVMFNGLCKNILQVNFNADYLHIGKNLNEYCDHPVRSKMATLKRDYCNTPWKTVASIAGIALLIFTIIQTVFSILQVV